jgi:hypothetical protein
VQLVAHQTQARTDAVWNHGTWHLCSPHLQPVDLGLIYSYLEAHSHCKRRRSKDNLEQSVAPAVDTSSTYPQSRNRESTTPPPPPHKRILTPPQVHRLKPPAINMGNSSSANKISAQDKYAAMYK